MCPHPSSLMALCRHLPGLSCGEPRVHNHWILKGLALWFEYTVAVVCRPHLSAKTNLASAVVGPGALSTPSRWAPQSSFSAKFLPSVIQALRTVTGLTSMRQTPGPEATDLPRPSSLVSVPSFHHLLPTILCNNLSSLSGGAPYEVAQHLSQGPTPSSEQDICTLCHLCLWRLISPASSAVNAGAWIPSSLRV